ncbi:MAG: PilZ domain-containing protein [Pseudomonadota bacterium]
MRLAAFALVMTLSTGAQAQSGSQACVVINGIDLLHGIQTRLARNPDTLLFTDDVRVIRAQISAISDRAALDAVQSNALTIKGNTFLRFLQNTRNLLLKVSMDDPNSVTPHFTAGVRRNLSNVETYLVELRCSADEIAAAEETLAEVDSRDDDSDDAVRIVREAAEELLNLTNLFVFAGAALIAIVGMRLWQKFSARQRRRAKRYVTSFTTDYRLTNRSMAGRLVDINCFGTKLRHAEDAPIAKGARVAICICDEWVNGTVVWTNTHYAGVQFSRSITLKAVQQVRKGPAPGAQKQNGVQLDAAS